MCTINTVTIIQSIGVHVTGVTACRNVNKNEMFASALEKIIMYNNRSFF